jgi:hypothetical protein
MAKIRMLGLWLAAALPLIAEVHTVPPPGVPVPAGDRAALESGLADLGLRIEKLRWNPLVSDVAVYEKAVRFALKYNEFFKADDIERAKLLLEEGRGRAAALERGDAPWATATGLVVRGYISKIDGSVQPYGLVIPPSFSPGAPHRWRLDAWFHGRQENLSEVNFLFERERNPGEFTPRDTIVLHLYGRYCNANKLAGEVDLFEALDAVKRQYAIDGNRIVIRGFSMGGAAAWHFAVHYAGDWAAAAPGAGFSETPQFLKVFQKETVQPQWWEEKLWHMYDADDYAINLFNCPTVAYSGEIDIQKQAADVMAEAMAREGMRLTHIIGPDTAHKYHPDSKIEINRLIDAIAERGRDPYPRRVRFATWTLAYNRMKWVVIDALGKHWERAKVDAEIVDDHTVDVRSANVTAFTLEMGPGGCPLDIMRKPDVVIDGVRLAARSPMSDRSWSAHFRKDGGQWMAVDHAGEPGLLKRHGLQGPIDDAFLSSFIMVRPTGTPMVSGIARWVAAEQEHAISQWRRQFRGEAQVRDDTAITDDDIAASNLVLWGDPGSNRILERIADRLPVRWTKDAIAVGSARYPSARHVLLLIYPNPLNPKKYVVLNSGVTFREYDDLNNARQIPKLPDFAVVDTNTPPGDRWPGKVAAAGFFGERWELLAKP